MVEVPQLKQKRSDLERFVSSGPLRFLRYQKCHSTRSCRDEDVLQCCVSRAVIQVDSFLPSPIVLSLCESSPSGLKRKIPRGHTHFGLCHCLTYHSRGTGTQPVNVCVVCVSRGAFRSVHSSAAFQSLFFLFDPCATLLILSHSFLWDHVRGEHTLCSLC